MIYLIVISMLINFFLLSYLIILYTQVREWLQVLRKSSEDSNLRLTSQIRTPLVRDFCRQVNQTLDQQKDLVVQHKRASQELKYISHDIRTPLTGARGYVQLLQSRQQEPALTAVANRLEELENLLDQLFLYSKLSQDDYDLEMAELAIYPILAKSLAGFYQQYQEAGLELDLDFPDEDWCLEANEEALERIFSNLLKNALIHGQGQVKIWQDGQQLHFENQLANVDDIEVDRLFERFYQADASRQKRSSGLGLSIVAHLMEKLGGQARASLDKEKKRLRLTLDFGN